MALKDEIPQILNYINSKAKTLGHNAQLFDIYEGDLLSYVLADLQKQLSAQSYEQIQHRVSPVNVLRRLIDKLSKIYSKPPVRWLENKSESDSELFKWYQRCFDINTNMGQTNEFFNLFKNSAIEPFVKDGKPALRVIPSDRFLVYSTSTIDPTEPTHFIKLMGKMKLTTYDKKGNPVEEITDVYYIYTDTEFLPINSKGDVLTDILVASGNPDGVNPYGKIPFVYINRSRHNLCPQIDTDTLRMTKIFPILLSDLNFAVMYQAFSIIYGIDVDDDNIVMSPNAFWRFKSDPTNNNKPQIGVIKPQVDIQQVITFIMSQLSFWLQSRNVRPGSVGQVSAENISSGVSKIVDEMDTYEDRQKQIPYFEHAETELFNLIINYMHPYWVNERLIDEKRLFSPGQVAYVQFPEQRPMTRRAELIADIKEELMLGLVTREDALIRLNPEMSEEDATLYLIEIDKNNTVEVHEVNDGETAENSNNNT